ncbi:ankyrin-3 [Trichomycterus rosablanca]|uniref:ankyrin-3 n=1 Tax=Trichomycterus rosablanca TaxID=2290929 RepID=UPI002F350E71
MGDVSEASLLDYIYSSGGKVTNSDLMRTFKQFVNHRDLQLRAKYREEFKLIIDRIAVCKSEDGEKYLILKKKYRLLMQDRKSEPLILGQKLGPGPMQARKKEKTAQVEWCVGPTITVTETEEETENQVTDGHSTLLVFVENAETPEPTDAEDELEKDSGSKSESEHDEESMGSVGSAAVTLDPIEKEWIYSAACGRLSHLTQLLKQDISLANKKDFTSFTALHWAAKHGKEDMAAAMADAGADVNTKAHVSNRSWLAPCLHWKSPGTVTLLSHAYNGYTPLHIAALHGHLHIVDLLIQVYGAKENLRDYSGHFASHYLNIQTKVEESIDLNAGCQSPAQVNERRNKKLTSLFQSRKKWGSAEELAPVPEERSVPQQLMIPAFRPRKFSR